MPSKITAQQGGSHVTDFGYIKQKSVVKSYLADSGVGGQVGAVEAL